jgi:hypothetical protein
MILEMMGRRCRWVWPTLRAVWLYLWAAPLTLVGLLCAVLALALGATAKRHGGVLEIASGTECTKTKRQAWLQRCPFVAITLGHVILGRDHSTLAQWRSHEIVHVHQMERWGVFFPLAYLAASGLALLQGKAPYWDNAFEIEARLKAS